MKRVFYLIAISAIFLGCGDTKGNNNTRVDVGKDVSTSDDGDIDMGADDVSKDMVCEIFVPETVNEDSCNAGYVCKMVDDNCGGLVEECGCKCPTGDSCGSQELGVCVDDTCDYGSPELSDLLSVSTKFIFVSEGATGVGTKVAPYGSYSEAIQNASSDDVILIRGEFNEQISIKDGVHIIGGWNDIWRMQGKSAVRPEVDKMDISKPWAALIGTNHSSNKHTIVANLEIRTPDASTNETSSYGIFLDDVWISFVNIEAFGGIGGDGTDGVSGSDGAAGTAGLTPTNTLGSNVVPNNVVPVGFYSRTPWPKAAAVNNNCPADTAGGKGGNGNFLGWVFDPQTQDNEEEIITPESGEDGSAGLGGAGGGRAVENDDVALWIPAEDGASSTRVAPDGSAGASGSFDNEVGDSNGFPVVISAEGSTGANGFGGGGGGGGVLDMINDSGNPQRALEGPSGSGGGSGGCGGEGGKGGQSGGGSFGLYAHNSDLILSNSEFSSNRGGLGGDGGEGGSGGSGGFGGLSLVNLCWLDLGSGNERTDCGQQFSRYHPGAGGDGANGGKGGQGGGGAGGLSYGAYCRGTTVREANEVTFRKGGQAIGGAPNGLVGKAEDQKGCE